MTLENEWIVNFWWQRLRRIELVIEKLETDKKVKYTSEGLSYTRRCTKCKQFMDSRHTLLKTVCDVCFMNQ